MSDAILKSYFINKGILPDNRDKPKPKMPKEKSVVEQVNDVMTLQGIIDDKPKIKVVKEYLQEMVEVLNKKILDDDD